jgi:hypothetical protein
MTRKVIQAARWAGMDAGFEGEEDGGVRQVEELSVLSVLVEITG